MNGRIFKNVVLLLICVGCFCSSKTFAYNYESCFETFDNQFEKVSEDKYYVKPGSIFVSSEEIFLCCEGQLLPVNFVECDEGGVFVRSNAFKWGQCPVCKWPLTPWGTCSNSNCPTKG